MDLTKIAPIATILSFVLALANYMKWKKKLVTPVLAGFGVILLIVSVMGYKKSPATQNVQTSGNNSPASVQSATSSGNNSPILQAAPNSTQVNTFNSGVSQEQLQKMYEEMRAAIRQKSAESQGELAKQYSRGYFLFGAAPNGKIVYLPEKKDIPNVFWADWDRTALHIDQTNKRASLFLRNYGFLTENSMMAAGNEYNGSLPLIENKPFSLSIPLGVPFPIFFEILDASKGIYVLGTK